MHTAAICRTASACLSGSALVSLCLEEPGLSVRLAENRDPPAAALKAMGRAAVPVLLEAAKSKRGEIRQRALFLLGEVGPEAKAAVPLFLQALKDPDAEIRRAALRGLAGVGPAARPALPLVIGFLKDKESEMREATAAALGKIGSGEAGAVLGLCAVLTGPDREEIGKTAAKALGELGPAAKAAVPALLAAAKKGEPESRRAAALALTRVDPRAAREIIPFLLDNFKQDIVFRDDWAEALRRIGRPAVPGLVEALLEAIKRSRGRERNALVEALVAVDPKAARSLVPLFCQALEGVEGERIIPALIALRGEAKAAVPHVLKAFARGELPARAVLAFVPAVDPDKISGLTAALVEEVEARLKRSGYPSPEGDRGEQERAARVAWVGNFGPEARVVAPLLLAAATNHEERTIRLVAAEALLRIDSKAARAAAPAISNILRQTPRDVKCLRVARLLLSIGTETDDAVAALLDVLASGKEEFAEAMKILSRAGSVAVPALRAALKDDCATVRYRVAVVRGRIGPEAKGAVPALRAAVKDSSWPVRSAAAAALGKVGPAAKAAVPALLDSLKDEEGDVRQEAARALQRIDPEAARKAGIKE